MCLLGMGALAWFVGNSRGFTGQRGRGSAPSAALGALRTEPPPCVPGMRASTCAAERLENGAPPRPAFPMGSPEDFRSG